MSESEKQDDQSMLSRNSNNIEQDVVHLQEENKSLRTQLSDIKAQAETAESLKSRFLANISHELRTPMNGILGMTELLQATELSDSQRKFTNSISRSTESLLYIVNDLLDFSALHHGTLELDDNVFFFGKMVQDVCDLFRNKASDKNITLVCNTESHLQSPVIGDEFRIRQVLSNLIDNAIKFTSVGEIIVTERADPDTGCHTITVTDTGSGIDPDVQSEIFKSFAQADNSSTRRHGGTGLGLAIANQLAEMMGGEISIRSEKNKGSRFTFTCILREGNPESVNEVGKNTLKGVRTLVVDDTETNLEILSLQLQQWELEVECASSGSEALQKLQDAAKSELPFQLAILDLNMPGMDGLELAQHIQAADYAEELRLMMLTSSVVEVNQKELERRGILKSMMKPARQALLYESISRIMHESRAPVPTKAADENTTILLTEDDPINQEVATIMLESMGYHVVVADNGAEAVDVMQQENAIDLILMDCQMPVMDGFKATKTIRSNNITTPIIALTANATQQDKDHCFDAGMNDYLTKPVYQTDLARVVQQWVSKPSASADDEITDTATANTHEETMNIKIDESALDAIRSLQRPGKPDILARIVKMYIEKSPELISAIEDGVAANDCDKVKMAAHTLKSSSAYVGASSLAEVCNRVESRAVNDELAEAADDIKSITSGYNSVVTQIKQYA